jgi:C-terminal processing protease CtpA/Prc
VSRALIIVFALTAGACTGRIVNPFPDNFVGVGVELTMREEAPTVVRTLRGGPAEQAGLEAEDRLVAIDHSPTRGMALADIVVRLRGQEGSPVSVTVQRGAVAIETQLIRHGMERTDEGYAARR